MAGPVAELASRVRDLEIRVGKAERTISWILGVGVGAGTILGMLIEALRKKLGFG